MNHIADLATALARTVSRTLARSEARIRLRNPAGRRRDERGFIAISTAAAAVLLGCLAVAAITMAGSSISTQRGDYLVNTAEQNAQQGLQSFLVSLNAKTGDYDPYCPSDQTPTQVHTDSRSGYMAGVGASGTTVTATGYAYASTAMTPPVTLGAADAHVAGPQGGSGVTIKTLSDSLSWRDVYSATTDSDGSPTYGVTADGPSPQRTCDAAAQAAGEYANHGLWADTISSDAQLVLSGALRSQTSSNPFQIASYGTADVNLAGATLQSPTARVNLTGYGVTPTVTPPSDGSPVTQQVSQFPATFDHNLINERIENYVTPTCLATMRPRNGTVMAAGATYCLASGSILSGTWQAPASGVATVLINGDVTLDGLHIAQTGAGQVHIYVTGSVSLGDADDNADNELDGTFVYAPYGPCTTKGSGDLAVNGSLACHGVSITSTGQVTLTAQPPLPDPLPDAAIGSGKTKVVYFLDRSLDASAAAASASPTPQEPTQPPVVTTAPAQNCTAKNTGTQMALGDTYQITFGSLVAPASGDSIAAIESPDVPAAGGAVSDGSGDTYDYTLQGTPSNLTGLSVQLVNAGSQANPNPLTIHFTAITASGGSCTGTVSITVAGCSTEQSATFSASSKNTVALDFRTYVQVPSGAKIVSVTSPNITASQGNIEASDGTRYPYTLSGSPSNITAVKLQPYQRGNGTVAQGSVAMHYVVTTATGATCSGTVTVKPQ